MERLKLYHKPVYRDGNFWWYLILNKDMKLRGNIKKTETKKGLIKNMWGGAEIKPCYITIIKTMKTHRKEKGS